ncbi:hypothetical protein BGZ52_006699, partial [Haplosporangium bisporale]
MEPNPFEQSFLDVSPDKPGSTTTTATTTTTDITTQAEAPMVAVTAGDASKATTVLPPIASMSGRLAANNNSWDAQSLRMGPLSPSMLEGPQNPVSTNAPIPAAYNATIVEDGFPFPAPTQPQAQQHQQPHYHPGHPQVNDQRYMAQRGPHPENPETYGNLHLLSQATNREMWVKRETEKGQAPMQGHLQQQHPNVNNHYQQQQQQHQQHHHQQQGQYVVQQQQPPQHRPPQHGQALPGMPGMVAAPQLPKNGVEPAFVRGVRRGKMTSEEISEDSDQSGHTNDGSSSGKKRAATEDKMDDEEKRKNFLERNRQ